MMKMKRIDESFINLFIDDETANMQLPDPGLVNYYNDIADRCLFISGEIGEDLTMFSRMIIKWNKEDKANGYKDMKPIRIYIDSCGGMLDSTMNFIDVIKMSKTPVYTIGMSMCYSSAGLILMNGHKRFIFSNTTFLLHDGYAGDSNSIGKMMDRLEFTKKHELCVKNMVLEATEITSEEYDTNYTKDWYMFADEVIKYGVADTIVTELDEVM